MRAAHRLHHLLLLLAILVTGFSSGGAPGADGSLLAGAGLVGPSATRAWFTTCSGSGGKNRILVSPGRDLARLARTHRAGTVFCIRRGVHRLRAGIVPKSRQVFVGESGAVLSGAKDITSRFVRSGQLWVASEQTQHNSNMTGQCQPGSPACVYPNDVFLDGRRLRRVLDREDVRSGRFFFDHEARQIWIAVDPRGRRVEASVATRAFGGWGSGASDVVIRGLIVEKFANEGSTGAVQARDGWIIDANDVRLNHAIGIQGGHVVTRNRIYHNGQLGFAIHGSTGTLFADNEVAYNNAADYDWMWEAGGAKFMVTTNLTVRGNRVHHNRSAGLSTDWDNITTLYEENVVEDNAGPGIVHEASYDAVIRANVVRRNGLATRGGFDGAGINISASQNVAVLNNTIEHNLHGVGVVASRREVGRFGEHATRNVLVQGNIITLEDSIGASGLASGDPADYTTNNNRFQANRYTYCQVRAFAWRNASGTGYTYVTKDQWVAAGNDTTGSFNLRPRC